MTWLIQLSKDPVETVRISALPHWPAQDAAVQKRLAEMARTDDSEAVRQAARKLVPSRRRDDGVPAPPARLAEPESEGELMA